MALCSHFWKVNWHFEPHVSSPQMLSYSIMAEYPYFVKGGIKYEVVFPLYVFINDICFETMYYISTCLVS